VPEFCAIPIPSSYFAQTISVIVEQIFSLSIQIRMDRLCGLVVRVPGYRSRGPWFDSRRYQIFWEVVGLERGPLSLVSKIEELLGRNNSGFGLENREYVRGDPLRWPFDTLYPQKLALTSPTSGDRSVGIVRLRVKATEFYFIPIRILSLVGVTIDGVLDRLIGVIDTLFTQLGTTSNYSTIAITVTHALRFSVFTSSILATDL
jgi:hypothetical protein